jgi:hypothetical protein
MLANRKDGLMNLQQAFSQLEEVEQAMKEVDGRMKAGDRKSETCSQHNSIVNQWLGLTEYIRRKLSEEEEIEDVR